MWKFREAYSKHIKLPDYFLNNVADFQPQRRQRRFVKKAVLKIFAIWNIYRKAPVCWSLFLIKLQAFRPANLLKQTPTQCFPVNIAKFWKTSANIVDRVLLYFLHILWRPPILLSFFKFCAIPLPDFSSWKLLKTAL